MRGSDYSGSCKIWLYNELHRLDCRRPGVQQVTSALEQVRPVRRPPRPCRGRRAPAWQFLLRHVLGGFGEGRHGPNTVALMAHGSPCRESARLALVCLHSGVFQRAR